MVDLIESMKRSGPATMNVDDTRSAKSEKSDKPRVIVEKIIERSPSDMEKQKDWAPLMGDFDKRMDKLERKLNDQDATNNRGIFSVTEFIFSFS